jgi:hypothetical protein
VKNDQSAMSLAAISFSRRSPHTVAMRSQWDPGTSPGWPPRAVEGFSRPTGCRQGMHQRSSQRLNQGMLLSQLPERTDHRGCVAAVACGLCPGYGALQMFKPPGFTHPHGPFPGHSRQRLTTPQTERFPQQGGSFGVAAARLTRATHRFRNRNTSICSESAVNRYPPERDITRTCDRCSPGAPSSTRLIRVRCDCSALRAPAGGVTPHTRSFT